MSAADKGYLYRPDKWR